MTPNDLREYAEFNREFLNTVREGMRAPPQPARLQINVENIYKEMR